MSVKELVTRLSVLLLLLLSCAPLFAQDEPEVTYPVVTGLGAGKYIITVNAAGQINNLDLSSETYSALATATELRVVTEGETQLSGNDMTRLCGNDFQFATLDLENAKVSGATGNNQNNNLKKLNAARSGLKNIVFPIQDGMWIPDQCFQSNTKIESIIIPDYPDGSTYRIGSGAFSGCTSLLRASIGKGTSSLGGDPYVTPDLTGKEMVTKDADHPNGVTIDDLTLINNESIFKYGVGEGVFSGCTSLYSLVLDDDITSIRNQAFQNCSSIEYIQLPKNLTALGNNSFAGCSSVTTIILPEKLRFIGSAIFQGMSSLSDVYLLADDIPLPFGGNENPIFVVAQTNAFKYTAGENPTYSQADYTGTQNQSNPIAILHYPATTTAKNNYRWQGHEYRLVDSDGTTWPNQKDIDDFNIFATSLGDSPDIFKGWKYFLQGNQNDKRDDIFEITRFKESRWYSVCFPFDLTVDKFQNAFGARAALSEFAGFTYDDDSKNMTIHFDVAAVPNSNDVILKANHPYMIHPSRLVESDDDPIQIFAVNNLMEHYRLADALAKKQQIIADYNDKVAAYNQAVDEGKEGTQLEPYRKAMNDAKKLYDEWQKVKDDETVDAEIEAFNQRVWYTEQDAQETTGDYRIRRDDLPAQLNNPVKYYFRGNYIQQHPEALTHERFENSTLADQPLPAGCYYLGGLTETFYHRKKAGSKWTPYTAILDPVAQTGGDPTLAREFSFSVDELESQSEPTVIGNKLTITVPLKNDGRVFNMQGQQVSSKSIGGLPKGMYIMNGKKYVVK